MNGQTFESKTLLELSLEKSTANKALSLFEQDLIQTVPMINADTLAGQALLNDDQLANALFLHMLSSYFDSNKSRQALKDSIKTNKRIVELNQNNLIAYEAIWKEMVQVIVGFNDYDVDLDLL